VDNEFKSQALEANLQETRHDSIEIPESHRWFLDLSKDYWGIHKRTEEFVEEYNHKFVNYGFILECLHNISLNDLWFYSSIPESEEAFLFLTGVFSDLTELELEDRLSEQLMKTLFKFIDRMLKEGKPSDRVLTQLATLIALGLEKDQKIYLRNAGYFKTYLPRMAALPEFRDEVFRLTRLVLEKSLEYWEDTSRAEEWLESKDPAFREKYRDRIPGIGKEFFSALREQIGQSDSWESLVDTLFFNDIANHFRHFSEEFELPVEKIQYLFYVMHIPGMLPLKNHLLYDMNRLLRDALAGLSYEERFSFTDLVFDLFSEFRKEHAGTILDCLLTLGREIVNINEIKLISYFNKKLISFGFIPPGDLTISEDWQTRVNDNHVKNIRVWLELIETSPNNFKKLLSALVVNLKLGGIFISDTDLFQRDVTRLLNADITPVYKQIKQLARFFPVYFREIGAEGKLREASTALDELSRRKDRLIHFLRKQIHSESNNTHIELIRNVARYWLTGDLEPLSRKLPEDVIEAARRHRDYFSGVHTLMTDASGFFGKDHLGLLLLPEKELSDYVDRHPLNNRRDKKRVIHLHQIHSLLMEKYSLEATDIVGILSSSRFFSAGEMQELKDLLEGNDPVAALQRVFALMGRLKEVILDPQESQALESIYYKRHIAIGIPSMYGQYSEPKFEALGLMYRLEKVASRLMEDVMSGLKLEYVTAKTLNNIYQVLTLFREGMALDGMENQNFNSNLEMFRYSLSSPSFTLGQYMNIFQFMALNIKEIINEYFMRFYDYALNSVVPQLFDDTKETLLKKSETFYREVLSSAFLIQELDQFITEAIDMLRGMLENYSDKYISNMMTYNPDLTVSSFSQPSPEMDNRVFLGAKAYYLKMLTSYGFPIPPGFVLTTEVFRHRETVLDHPYMSLELESLLLNNIAEIERATGLKFGSRRKPLFLSVRSGTAISLPGAMSTFLNVGINDEIARALGENPETAWMAWDSYRRFIQSWGMANGIGRPVFDQLMKEAKEKHGVSKKAQFSAEQMRELVDRYKEALDVRDIQIHPDPFVQLRQAIATVLDSWDSERARSYRRHLQIADEWGTAVIIQKMVMGNRSQKSGSGVVFTHNPKLSKPGVNLYGDFTLCSQGEDIVAGLVHTLPISESQRREDYPDSDLSLQSAFPGIYQGLKDHSWKLIYDYGFSNQEIEFTFESEQPEDLYILQTREQIITSKEQIPIFSTPIEKMQRIGRGIGIDGGSMSGLLCFDLEDLNRFKKDYPDENLILVRPDTVPDDIPKIFLCDGLVTSRGGVTSHSAVTAAKLGKVCIVNCKELVVDDDNKQCRINNIVLNAGDALSIDGKSGNIFLGSYPIEYLP